MLYARQAFITDATRVIMTEGVVSDSTLLLSDYHGAVGPSICAGSTGLKNVVAAVEWAVRCEVFAEVDASRKQQQQQQQQQQKQQQQQQQNHQQQQQQRSALNSEPISSQHLRHVIASFLDGESFTPEYAHFFLIVYTCV
jgi:L-lactate permease